jgi:hypothetical protein
VGFKIERTLDGAGIEDFIYFSVNIEADENANLFNGFEGFIKLVKAAAAEVAYQNVKVLNVLESLFETVKKG